MKEIGNYYDTYDLFARAIPTFHIEGHRKIGTIVGCSLSVLLATLVIGYSCIRGRYLFTGHRPNISSFTVDDERNGTELIHLMDYNFKVAFAVTSVVGDSTTETAHDPNFVEWSAYFYDT
jgi:hypothetical protein